MRVGNHWPALALAWLWAAGAGAETIELRRGLSLEPVGRARRNTLFTDAIEARIAAGTWSPPREGETVADPAGRTHTWEAAQAGTNGVFKGAAFTGGWARFEVTVASQRVMILEASGHDAVYVNGEPRAGDVYRNGYVHLPVQLRAGANEFLFRNGRGELSARLVDPPSALFFNLSDPTLPDFVVGKSPDQPMPAGVIVVNATSEPATNLTVVATVESGRSTRRPIPSIPPLSARKVPIALPTPSRLQAGKTHVSLALHEPNRRAPLATASIEVRIQRPDQPRKETFISDIDGSVQYYAVNPAAGGAAAPALFLSLHGASVEALGQAESYSPKSWGTVVAPTNRRPYGFDWEEWGRFDALEVLELATREFHPDPARIYLTGHSMGGHGSWNLAANCPDLFAAVGPSAGWISFWSYAGSDPYTNSTGPERMLRRAAAASDTLLNITNLAPIGVYVIHGDADDNVPVTEAREMRRRLAEFHHDVSWHEQPGAGHWWDDSDEPGASCVDWAPMFDFFARHRHPAPAEIREIDFSTVSPAVSSRDAWVEIWTQSHSLESSRVRLRWDPGQKRITGTTENIEILVLRPPSEGTLKIHLDGQWLTNAGVAGSWEVPPGHSPVEAPKAAKEFHRSIWLQREHEEWRAIDGPAAGWKDPERAGPFKDAWRHRPLLVYGSCGTPEENAWAKAKARFDAEAFWYRGNGAMDILPDRDFEPAAFKDRGVVLYGHREMNSAWAKLLNSSPIQVNRGRVTAAGRTVVGDDLACVFLRPRSDSAVASVAVVAGTGLPGLRTTNRLPYFLAGTGFPDCLIVGADAFLRGTSALRAAGFFGPDWSLDRGDFVWSEDGPARP